MSLDIDYNELISVLGEPSRSAGSQHYFQCPACAAGGGDTSCDNLLFNSRKGVLKCFACDDGSRETLKLVNARRQSTSYKPAARAQRERHVPWYEKNADNLWQYQCEAEAEMTDDVFCWLQRRHGIGRDIACKCGIGYDSNPTVLSMGSSVAFPMFSINHKVVGPSGVESERLVGFELREISVDRKVIKHTPEAPSCLCLISGDASCKKLAICEGFKDAYCFWQLLQERASEFLILSPAHGVGDILKNLSTLSLNSFDKCFLILDNDKAGDNATAAIVDAYPCFIDKRSILRGCNDVAEYWMKKQGGDQ